jgi:hypothetical protein
MAPIKDAYLVPREHLKAVSFLRILSEKAIVSYVVSDKTIFGFAVNRELVGPMNLAVSGK